jgi:hypothetical protein
VSALILALVSVAHADPLLHDAADADAVRRDAAARAKVDPSTLRPITPHALFATPLTVVGAKVTTCAGAALAPASIEALVEEAEAKADYLEAGALDLVVTRLEAALPCLDQKLDPARAARVYLLQGHVHFQLGHTDLARAAWRQAHLLYPGIPWDPDLPPAGIQPFERVRAELGSGGATVRLVPDVGGAVTIDGRPVPVGAGRLAVVPGRHVLQFTVEKTSSLLVEIAPGAEVSVIVGAVLDETLLGWPANRALWPDLDTVTSAAFGAGATVYVRDDKRLYRGQNGSWEPLAARRSPLAAILTWGGVGLAAGGGAALVVGGVRKGMLEDDARDQDWTQGEWDAYYEGKEEWYSTPWIVGEALVASGVALGAASVVPRLTASPTLWADGAGLRVELVR